MSRGLRFEDRDGVTVVRMEFGKANALGPAVVEELIAGLGNLAVPTVLTGEGRVFSAGLDLIGLDGLERSALEEFVDRFSVLMMQLLTARVPMVAAVNGHAVAGGCVLMLACDHRIGVSGDYKLGLNELAIGLTLPAVAMEIPRGVLTPSVHRRVVLDADLCDPQTALADGLVDRLVDDADTAIDSAVAQARRLGTDPKAFASVKGAVVAPVVEAIRARREAFDRRFVDVWFSDRGVARRREAIERLTGE